MSSYRDRLGQRIGPWVVMADHGRTTAGRVIWRLQHDDGRKAHLHTYAVIQLDQQLGGSGE